MKMMAVSSQCQNLKMYCKMHHMMNHTGSTYFRPKFDKLMTRFD